MPNKDLKEKLFYKPTNAAKTLSDKEIKKAFDFSEDYKIFLDNAKTERLAVDYSIELLLKNGFSEYELGKKYKPGDRIYFNNRGKALIIVVMGKESLDKGTRIVASHIDSPRLDLKPRPFYEDSGLALLKTHYFGGIKKYQWVAIPLSLHGVLIKGDGSTIKISIGEDMGDPVFCATDLLPHLAADQGKKPLSSAIEGEDLNLLIGSLPFKSDDDSDAVKLNILNIIYEKYGVTERDFISAELEAVPAYKASDVGFDRSMVGSYGHDDRVCAYTSLMASIELKVPTFTSINILADKEETGSNSSTGLNTDFYVNFIKNLAKPFGIDDHIILSNSKCLSADVGVAFDPTFPTVLEKNNAAYLNHGAVITKYTGVRGKGGTNDANAEFVGEVTNMLDKAGVIWQIGELGKVDQGGGGTVAVYLAARGIEVLDIGVPVLSMHAPFEVVSKIDTYMAYKAFEAFYK